MRVNKALRGQSAIKTPSKEAVGKLQSFKLKERGRVYERLRKELEKKLEEPGLQERVKQVILKQSAELDN